MKDEIKSFIMNGEPEKAEKLLEEYKKKNPYDVEIFSFYVSIGLMTDNKDKALGNAIKARLKNPFLIANNYNLAVCYEAVCDHIKAYVFYRITEYLQEQQSKEIINAYELKKDIIRIKKLLAQNGELDSVGLIEQQLKFITGNVYRTDESLIGRMIRVFFRNYYYPGYADDTGLAYYGYDKKLDAITGKLEIYPYSDTIYRFKNDTKTTCLLPVVMNDDLTENEENNNVAFRDDLVFPALQHKKYSRFVLNPGEEIEFLRPVISGKEIPLRSSTHHKKRLILNIFIDSVNYSTIEKYGLDQIMPNTAAYFSDGASFSNYFVGSEYTLPSIATYWTGRLPSTHMYLSEQLKWDFLSGTKSLVRYFKETGYVTAKIGENDAVTITQGYGEDFDRIIFGSQIGNKDVKNVILDVMEHIETFKENDQYIWMEIQDLHDIAGYYSRGLYTESKQPLQYKTIDNITNSTVKQTYSRNKEFTYVQELRRMDMFLESLYHYISSNYNNDEIIVALFSDHGTAFNVATEDHFMSIDRVRVPFMLKCSDIMGEYDEIIQSTDFAGIMCRLAGIDYEYSGTDANLPRCFGGSKERQFAFSQCLFPGDPYLASIHTKEKSFYFTSVEKIQKDFTLSDSKMEIYARDRQKKDITKTVDTKEYEDYIYENIGHLIVFD